MVHSIAIQRKNNVYGVAIFQGKLENVYVQHLTHGKKLWPVLLLISIQKFTYDSICLWFYPKENYPISLEGEKVLSWIHCTTLYIDEKVLSWIHCTTLYMGFPWYVCLKT